MIANFVGRGLSAGLGILLIPRYTYYLGIEAQGLIQFNALLYQAFNLLDMGLSATLTREMARRTVGETPSEPADAERELRPAISPERAQEARNLVRTLEIVYWPIALVIALSVGLMASFITHHWLQRPEHLTQATVQQSVLMMGLSLAVQWPYTLYEGGLMGLQRQVLLNGIIGVMALVRGLGALMVVWLYPTVQAFFGWQIFSSAILTGLVCIALWHSLPSVRKRPRFEADALRQLWRFALGMTGITTLGFILTQMDKFLLSRMLPLSEFAYYGYAWSAAGGIYFIIAPLYSAFFPRFVQTLGTKSRSALSELYHRACQIMATAILPVAATMAIFSKELMLLWTRNPTTTEHTHLFVTLMAISFGLFGLMHMPLATLLAKGWTRYLLVHNLASVLIAAPLLFWAAQHYGPIGACIVWMCVNAAYLLVMVPILHARLLKGEFWRWAGADTLAPGLAATAVALTARQILPIPATWFGLLALLTGVGGLALLAAALAAPIVRAALLKVLQPLLKRMLRTHDPEARIQQESGMNEGALPPAADLESQAVVTAPVRPPREHFDYLDGLRALAALYVVLHHAWLHIKLPPGWTSRLTFGLQFGHFAVDVFIVLSGFCLMLPVVRGEGQLRGGIGGFLQRRARRILPPYYAAVALSLVLIWTLIGRQTGTHWDVSVPVQGSDFLAHLFLVQDMQSLASGAKINHPLWSVAVEWHIYFLFPLLVMLWRRYGGIRSALFTTLISYLAGVAAVYTGVLEGMHFQYIGLFALGMLGATFAFSPQEVWRKRREGLPWGGIAAGVLALALACGYLLRRIHGITIYVDPLIGVSTASLLIAMSRSKENWTRRAIEWKPLVFIGGFSYSLYLIHAPLLQVIWQYGILPLHRSETISFWILATAGTALILGASYLFSLMCERPFMNTVTRTWNKT